MNPTDDNDFAWPEILAAFADGELDASTADMVRRRIREDKMAQVELEGQLAFSACHQIAWQRVQPELPQERQWTALWRAIDRELSTAAVANRDRRRTPWFRRGLLGLLITVPTTVVAAAVMAVCLPHSPPPMPTDGWSSEMVAEVFRAAEMTDIHLLSVRDADVAQFVVGVAPLETDLPLVNSQDVRLEEAPVTWDPVESGLKPDEAGAPLILTPSVRSR